MNHLLLAFIAAGLSFVAVAQNAAVRADGSGSASNTIQSSTSAYTNREDIRRLMTLTRVEENFRAVLPKLLEQIKGANPNISEAEWREFEQELNPEELLHAVIPIYEKHLSREDVKQLISFYETPLGQKFIREVPKITDETIRVGQEWGSRIAARIAEKHKREATAEGQPGRNQSQTNRTETWEEYSRRRVREMGLDPDKYTLGEAEPPAERPKNANFLVRVGRGNNPTRFYTEAEPKPFGNGYKFRDLQGVERTISGDIQIMRLPKK